VFPGLVSAALDSVDCAVTGLGEAAFEEGFTEFAPGFSPELLFSGDGFLELVAAILDSVDRVVAGLEAAAADDDPAGTVL
jgi:hypothetical protein